MYKLRKSHQRAINLYEKAFGEKHFDHTYLVRTPVNGYGVVVITAYMTESGVLVINDQVLVIKTKIYRNNELVYEDK